MKLTRDQFTNWIKGHPKTDKKYLYDYLLGFFGVSEEELAMLLVKEEKSK